MSKLFIESEWIKINPSSLKVGQQFCFLKNGHVFGEDNDLFFGTFEKIEDGDKIWAKWNSSPAFSLFEYYELGDSVFIRKSEADTLDTINLLKVALYKTACELQTLGAIESANEARDLLNRLDNTQ